MITTLIGLGCTRMTRGGIDRLYFGTEMLGEMAKDTKNFLNLKTGEVYSTAKDERKELLEAKMREIIEEAETKTSGIAEQAEEVEKMVTIEVSYSYQQVINLQNLTKRYSYLLNKATGFKRLEMPSRDRVIFWGMDSNNPAHCKLVELMIEFASAPRKIMERETLRPDNEKFAFRTWLIRLGWTGRETSKLRTSLYKGLDGDSVFCTATSKAKWMQKHGRKQEDWEDERNWVVKQEKADEDYWDDWEV